MVKMVPPANIPRELSELIRRCYKEKPDKKDLAELQKCLHDNPDIYDAIFNVTWVTRNKIIDSISDQEPVQISLNTNALKIREQMGYEQSPIIEKMLIDQVINTWIRCQWAELKYTILMQGQPSMTEGEYWMQILGASQRRYLHTVEVLARVRKITRATMQINIAESGSQQVNIAGDINKK
jgi:hypothetical protein